MEDFLQEFLIENCFIKVEFLDNKTGEITARTYMVSITEIRNKVK